MNGNGIQISNNICWPEMWRQKEWLVSQGDVPEALGLLELLDHVQDSAVEQGYPEETVFGACVDE